MNRVSTIALFLVIISFGCREEDHPDVKLPIITEFRIKDEAGEIREDWDSSDEIYFENLSLNATSFRWSFGDNTFSNLESTKHRFENVGTYRVVLYATNDQGQMDSLVRKVVIKPRLFWGIYLNSTTLETLPENMLLMIGETNNEENIFLFAFPQSLPKSALPFGGHLVFGTGKFVYFDNHEWFVTLIDNQNPLEYFDQNDKFLYSTSIYPDQIKGERDVPNHGFITIPYGLNALGGKSEDFIFKLEYILR